MLMNLKYFNIIIINFVYSIGRSNDRIATYYNYEHRLSLVLHEYQFYINIQKTMLRPSKHIIMLLQWAIWWATIAIMILKLEMWCFFINSFSCSIVLYHLTLWWLPKSGLCIARASNVSVRRGPIWGISIL